MSQAQWRSLSAAAVLFPCHSPLSFSRNRYFSFRPNNNHFPFCSADRTWIAQLSQELTTPASVTAVSPAEGRPVELLSSIPSILDAAGDSTAFQTASSIMLTGAFTLFLFRSFRRRAKRAKQMRIRSSAEALENLSRIPVKAKSPPSPDQALVGALIAAAFGVALYKFTTTIEYTLNHQTLSNNYSVRQITITIRTIINGLCYLATFVFAFNSLGLFLYSGQLAMNYFVEGEAQLSSTDSKSGDADDSGTTSVGEDQSSDKKQ